MKRNVTNRMKRTLGIVVSAAALLLSIIAFVCAYNRYKWGGSIICFLAVAVIVTFVDYFIWISNDKNKVMSITALATVAPALVKAAVEKNIVMGLLVICISVSLFLTLWFVLGRERNSKDIIKNISSKMHEFYDINIDWIKGHGSKELYPISVAHVNTIPNNQSSVTSIKNENLMKVLNRYGKGTFFQKNAKDSMLLIGDFGSGKSSALLQYVKLQLDQLVMPKRIPVYIRLTDLIDEELLQEIQNEDPLASGENQLSRDALRNKVFEKYYAKENDTSIATFFTGLHKKQRVMYLFDGFNEVLQRANGSNKEKRQLAKVVLELIQKLAHDNFYVLSTCTYPNIITNALLEDDAKNTEIYVIQGIELDKDQIESQKKNKYESILNSSVASYRLSKQKEHASIQDESNVSKVKSKYPTPYALLERFAKKEGRINSDDADQEEVLRKDLNRIVEDNLEQRNNLYLSLNIGNREAYLMQTRMFQKDSRTTCHALFFEYMLAQYARGLLNEEAFVRFFIGEKKEEQLVFKSPHIADAFKMMVTDIFVNGDPDEQESCKTRIVALYNCILGYEDPELEKRFLLLLSRIKDEINLYNSESNVESFGIDYDKMLSNKAKELVEGATISGRFQIYKLFSKNNEEKCENNDPLKEAFENKYGIKKLLKEALDEKWTHVGIQRQIIHKYIETENAWPDNSECRLNKYLMQEYPAELIDLDESIKKTGKSDLYTPFLRTRIRGIRYTTNRWYALLILFLAAQIIAFLTMNGIHFPALIIKIIGILLAIGSCWAWNKQLWKNEEYYGLALGDFSSYEPIYEVVKVVLNKKENGATDDHATIVVGDWLKNRPSIIFLLATVISVIYSHTLLQSWGMPVGWANSIEIILATLLLFVCCIPLSTWKYMKTIYKEKKKEDIWSIVLVLFLLAIVVIVMPIVATTVGERHWGLGTNIGYGVCGLLLFLFMWFGFVRKAEGVGGKEEGSPTPVKKRIIAIVGFLILFCAPGPLLGMYNIFGLKNDIIRGQVSAAIAVVVLALSVYLSLFYASMARKYRKEREDKNILDNNMGELNPDYEIISCGGQIELLNRFANRKNILREKETQKYLTDNAKTVQALDIVLDAEK